jgi:hypothetical protein
MGQGAQYWPYEAQVEAARRMGYSISWLRKELQAVANYQGYEIIFEHKPRSK